MNSPISTFADLDLRPELTKVLAELGYEEPTPIQSASFAVISAGRDVIGQAATGTGKTAAFSLPLLQGLKTGNNRGDHPQILVLVPTRELAMQVSEALHRYGRYLGTRVVPVYGGQSIVRQLRALDGGCDVVVATPGRAIDHISRNTLHLDQISSVVLDEADEMLDMGFAEDIESILEEAPKDRQTILFSATMPSRIQAIASAHQRNPEKIRIEPEPLDASAPEKVREVAYVVHRSYKPQALARVLDVEDPSQTLVFCRTREDVDKLTETLNGRGYRAEALHGGMDQAQRDRVMGRIKGGVAELLVATDVAARGLDIDTLTHVVNYNVPSSPESYVHRIGRVGRAGREGVAITLVEPKEHRHLAAIESLRKKRIERAAIPSVDDLRARRMEVTTETLRATLESSDYDRFRAVVEPLSEEWDLMEIALAAVKIAHEADSSVEDEEEIPVVELSSRGARSDRRPSQGPRGAREGRNQDRHGRGGGSSGMASIFVGAGSQNGVRPKDLVGAIAGETSLSGRDIGAIDVAPRFALVEVPAGAVGEVIAALRETTIKGRKVTVRRDKH